MNALLGYEVQHLQHLLLTSNMATSKFRPVTHEGERHDRWQRIFRKAYCDKAPVDPQHAEVLCNGEVLPSIAPRGNDKVEFMFVGFMEVRLRKNKSQPDSPHEARRNSRPKYQ